MLEIRNLSGSELEVFIEDLVLEDEKHLFNYDFINDTQKVFVYKGEDQGVLGFSFLSDFHTKQAYQGNYNLNIYVTENNRNNGIGADLWKSMISEYALDKVQNIFATCYDSQTSTYDWLQNKGFETSGKLDNVTVADKKHNIYFLTLKKS